MIFYQIYTLGFCGVYPEKKSDSKTLNKWVLLENELEYLNDLGITHIVLNPIFESQTHGYDIYDYYSVDKRLGTNEQFKDFIQKTHNHGMKIILDIALNHVSKSFVEEKENLYNGELSDWFLIDKDNKYAHFEQHEHLVKLNHNSQVVKDFAVDVLSFWSKLGVDGFRLDAAYDGDPLFYKDVIDHFKIKHENSFIFAEIIHGDYLNFQKSSSVDSITQYELWKAIYSSINDKNFYELAHAVDRFFNNATLPFTPMTFVDNHDVTRIASQIKDPRHLPHAILFWLMFAGNPIVYYGSEFGIDGEKIDDYNGDDKIRIDHTTFSDSKANNPIFRLHKNLINIRKNNPDISHKNIKELHLDNEVFVYKVSNYIIVLNLSDSSFNLSSIKTTPQIYEKIKKCVVLPHDWMLLEL